MTREDLIRQLVDKQGHVSYKIMCEAIKQLTDAMVSSLKMGTRVEVRGFGSFVLRCRPPRLARNPKTGTTFNTTSKFAIHFKPGKELREKVHDEYKDVT